MAQAVLNRGVSVVKKNGGGRESGHAWKVYMRSNEQD